MSTKKKKRTLSEEQLQKMKEGRMRAAKHRERVQMLSSLDERLKKASAESHDKIVKPKRRKRTRY